MLFETLIGALGALIILGFVYGSAIAVLPLLMALPSILVTFLLVLGLEQRAQPPPLQANGVDREHHDVNFGRFTQIPYELLGVREPAHA